LFTDANALAAPLLFGGTLENILPAQPDKSLMEQPRASCGYQSIFIDGLNIWDVFRRIFAGCKPV
jgi:hypothetical protein